MMDMLRRLPNFAGHAKMSQFSTSTKASAIIKEARLRVVDNSALAKKSVYKPPRCIHVYNKKHVGKVGDQILLAICKQKKKALIVGQKMPGSVMTPKFDTNNVILLEDNGSPTGSRITVPIPSWLRGHKTGEYSKIIAIATQFV